jgi:tetratricopeptide (TPR) repeat protein
VTASAFADDLDVLVGLESLLDKNLLFRLPVEEEPRFGLLETLRAYAQEQLEAVGETGIARRAHFDFYLALAELAAPKLRGPEQVAWLARLAADENNLRAALAWSLDDPTSAGINSLQLAGALGDFWYFGNRSVEGRRWLERALAFPLEDTPLTREQRAALARANSAAGTMAWLQSDLGQAIAYHEQALAGYRAIDDRRGVADALNNVATQYFYLPDYEKSRSLFDQSTALWR